MDSKRRMTALLLVVAVLVPVATASAQNLNQGLVAHYELDRNTRDSSGNAHHATAFGNIEYVRGPMRFAAAFDGGQKVIQTGLKFHAPNALSVCAWVRSNVITEEQQIIVGRPNSYPQLALRNHKAVLMFYSTNNDWVGVASKANCDDGGWYHIAGVWDGATLSIYVNGALDDTKPTNRKVFPDQIRSLEIGGFRTLTDPNAKSQNLNGVIDDVRLYSRALTAAEVKAIRDLAGTIPAGGPGHGGPGHGGPGHGGPGPGGPGPGGPVRLVTYTNRGLGYEIQVPDDLIELRGNLGGAVVQRFRRTGRRPALVEVSQVDMPALTAAQLTRLVELMTQNNPLFAQKLTESAVQVRNGVGLERSCKGALNGRDYTTVALYLATARSGLFTVTATLVEPSTNAERGVLSDVVDSFTLQRQRP